MSDAISATVLIIDDNPTNLEVLSEALDAAGYTVLVEMNGHKGLERVQCYPPDLILLDIMMPSINGLDVCHHLQTSPKTQEIPIIFMTALSDIEHKVQGFRLGAVDYITKPFQQEEVLARIQTHLKIRRLKLELIQEKRLLEQRVKERTDELSQALSNLKATQLQLVQSEKTSSIGQLVAGIAHEINNPIHFIDGNLKPAQQYVYDLLSLITLYQQTYPDPPEAIARRMKAIDLDYLQKDMLKLITSMKMGIDRISEISASLRSFSRSDQDNPLPFNLHEGLDSTLLILKHRLKANEFRPDIEVIKDYGELPIVTCFPGQINQVFMNILANAIDALEESNQGRSFEEIEVHPNQITIQTQRIERDSVRITISDNGLGIPESVKSQIFDYLFTTKPVEKGTGLGLAIAKQIVEEKHGGDLRVRSDMGQGATFIITLPLIAKPSE